MAATGHDAINGNQGTLLRLDVPTEVAPDVPDYTEDLAEEDTSELDPAPPTASPAAVAALLAATPGVGEVAAGNGAFANGARLLRDRYRLEAPVGNGGTATVYRAVDLRRDAAAEDDDRRVAIKLLRPELRGRAQSVARLQREFRQTRLVAHPNVVRFFDLDCDGDAWFIVMELLSGETLGSRRRRAAPAGLAGVDALRIACAVGGALAHAHARGVTHGDVKPDNIFLTDAGEVRLFDFGVAPEGGAGEPVAAAATRVYASPEVLAGEIPEPRDDVFSLGCLVHEMVAGRHPYGRRSAARVRDAAVVPDRLESLGPERAAAVALAISLERAGRPTMAEFVHALAAGEDPAPPHMAATVDSVVATSSTVTPAPAPAPAPVAALPAAAPGPRRSRFTLLVGLAGSLALVLGILIGRLDPGAETVATPASQRPPALPPSPQLPVTAAPIRDDAPVAAAPDVIEAQDAELASGGPPGMVFFDDPRMIVSKRAVVAAIPLRHLNHARRAVSVHWRTIDGTARTGHDYGGPPSGVESFVEGNSFRILYVPIVPNAGATRDRSFTVELTDVSDGADLGPTPRIEVTILGSS